MALVTIVSYDVGEHLESLTYLLERHPSAYCTIFTDRVMGDIDKSDIVAQLLYAAFEEVFQFGTLNKENKSLLNRLDELYKVSDIIEEVKIPLYGHLVERISPGICRDVRLVATKLIVIMEV